MDKHSRNRIRFRPTATGAAAVLFPGALLLRGLDSAGPASLVVGLGMPALVLLSLLFLLAGAVRILKTARDAQGCINALPGTCDIQQSVILETSPQRPGFLPGIRLSVNWYFTFGPFRLRSAAPLPPSGSGRAALTFSRRGDWAAYSFIRATDPFGFFRLDCPCIGRSSISVPPVSGAAEGADMPGRPVSETATAPRRREDAEERMEHRAYVRGDDPRRLDWKLYARTGDMQVRVGEDSLPYRGRLWLTVLSPKPIRFGRKKRIRRLDACLESAAGLIRSLEENGQDVRVRLPGESVWAGTGRNWPVRLAASLPAQNEPPGLPERGERYWIIAHPGDTGSIPAALNARNSGCRVSLGYPAKPGRSPGMAAFFLYRRQLEAAEQTAAAEGLDVTRI